MKTAIDQDRVTLIQADCLQALKDLPDNSIDSVVTDPPYELGFMGKAWDASGIAYSVELWREALRVLKPGGHLLAFGGTRTYHRMSCAIEDAGFEIRDSLHFMYGTGFPKSLNVATEMQKKGMLCECTGNVFGVRQDLSYLDSLVEADRAAYVLPTMQREGARQGLGETRAQRQGCLDRCEQGELPREDERARQPRLEGRGHVQANQGKLYRTEVRALPAGVSADVSQGRVRHGASACGGTGSGAMPASSGGSAPQGSQHQEQLAGESRAVSGQRFPQTCGSCGKTRRESVEPLGTALKPGHEPIVMARKPLIGTVAANVQRYGTGALNIDGCRLHGEDVPEGRLRHGGGAASEHVRQLAPDKRNAMPAGRWPANVLFDEDAARELDQQSGTLKARGNKGPSVSKGGKRDVYAAQTAHASGAEYNHGNGQDGGASRFFKVVSTGQNCKICGRPTPYTDWDKCEAHNVAKCDHGMTVEHDFCDGPVPFRYVAKPSRKERDLGCADLPTRSGGEATDREDGSKGLENPRAGAGRGGGAKNFHPTVKPIELMRYLCRLVTPPGGIVLDPFTGSGTTGVAALLEGFCFLGIERSEEYTPIAVARIGFALGKAA